MGRNDIERIVHLIEVDRVCVHVVDPDLRIHFGVYVNCGSIPTSFISIVHCSAINFLQKSNPIKSRYQKFDAQGT